MENANSGKVSPSFDPKRRSGPSSDSAPRSSRATKGTRTLAEYDRRPRRRAQRPVMASVAEDGRLPLAAPLPQWGGTRKPCVLGEGARAQLASVEQIGQTSSSPPPSRYCSMRRETAGIHRRQSPHLSGQGNADGLFGEEHGHRPSFIEGGVRDEESNGDALGVPPNPSPS
jgi:hypothetical protein